MVWRQRRGITQSEKARRVLHIEYAKCGNLSEGLRLAIS